MNIREKHAKRRKAMRKRYEVLFGTRITIGIYKPTVYELMDVNDLGIPYWAKVVRNKTQKTLFTLGMYSKKWLDKELARIKRKPKPLPDDAQNVTTLRFNNDEFTCYGIDRKGHRVYCRALEKR